jgi:hypothetical protein
MELNNASQNSTMTAAPGQVPNDGTGTLVWSSKTAIG